MPASNPPRSKTGKAKRHLVIAAFLLATIAFVLLEGGNILRWTMGCAFGVFTDAQYAECRRFVDLHFGVPIAVGVMIWGLLLWVTIRTLKGHK